MYTVCPECKAVFRISAQHLQSAGGSVRCGKCDHTFNALLYLTEEPPESGVAIPASIKIPTPDPEPVVETSAADDVDASDDEFVDDSVEEETARIADQIAEASDEISEEEISEEEISEEEASSTATGFAARIRRFLEAAEKKPELKADDTWSCDDEDEDSSGVDEPEELEPLEPVVLDAEVDPQSDLQSEPDSDSPSGIAPILTLVEESEDDSPADPDEDEYTTGEAATDETAPENPLETDLDVAEVVEDVDEFEAAVLATISESEMKHDTDGELESEEEPEQETEEETEEEPVAEADVIDESEDAEDELSDEDPIEVDLAALAENVIDSMPDVVIEGQSTAQKPEGEEKNEQEVGDLSSTADRVRTLDMLSDKEAETYFGEMLVDPDALAAEAQNDDESDATDDVVAELADNEADEADDDEADDDEADDDEADDDEADDDEADDDDDSDWRLADDEVEADDDEAEDDEAEDESPEPVLFIEADATDDEKDTDRSEPESLEFDVPEDQLDSIFTEAEAEVEAKASPAAPTDGETDDEQEDIESPDVARLASAASLAVENIELGSEHTPRHDISKTYRPPPAPKYDDGSGRKRLWMVAGIILATALTLQLVHFNRVSLSDSFIGSALKTVYSDLPRQTQPAWDISKYDIQRSAGVGSVTNTGTLTIIGRLTNSADFAQPFPVLKLKLLDRWGDQIGVRDLQMAQYLAEPQNAGSNTDMMNPFEAANIDISVVDPDGEPAANFVIEICLPDGKGGLACQ